MTRVDQTELAAPGGLSQPAAEPTPRQVRMALAVTAAFLLACVLVWAREAGRCDFAPLYTAGYMVLHGEGAKLYDLAEQQNIQQAVIGRVGFLPFLNPPFTALLFVPLAGLPYRIAYVVWDALNIALWIYLAVFMRRFISRPRNPFTYLLVCFLCWPCWIVLLQGQTSFVVLLAFALAFASVQEGREFRAGSCLGLGLLKFQLVLPFLLICLLCRKWRIVAGLASVGLILAMISSAVVGWSGSLAYARFVLWLTRISGNPGFGGFETRAIPSIAGFLDALVARGTGVGWLRLLAGFASAGLILLAAWRWRQEDARENDAVSTLAFATAVAVTLTAASYIHFHDLSLIALPLLIVLASPLWRPRSAWRWVLIASVAPFYTPPLWGLLVHKDWLYWLCPALLAFTAAMFALLSRRAEAVATAQGAALPIREGACVAVPLSGRGSG